MVVSRTMVDEKKIMINQKSTELRASRDNKHAKMSHYFIKFPHFCHLCDFSTFEHLSRSSKKCKDSELFSPQKTKNSVQIQKSSILEQGLNKLSIHKIIQNTGGRVSGNVC